MPCSTKILILSAIVECHICQDYSELVLNFVCVNIEYMELVHKVVYACTWNTSALLNINFLVIGMIMETFHSSSFFLEV